MEGTNLKSQQLDLHQTIDRLLQSLPDESSTRKQLNNYRELFDDAVAYLLNPNQRLAFIGNIGTGKTTAICYLLGLLSDDKPVLSVGSGRTTLCEVEIVSGTQLEIEVTPHADSEIKTYLTDFAQTLVTDTTKLENPDSFTLSLEVERALRNMLNLQKTRKRNSENKLITTDSAKSFATRYQSVELLTEKFLERINLPERNTKLFTYDDTIEKNEWLSKTFKDINSGTHPSVSLAKHIRISLPQKLFDDISFNLSVNDTKGVDQTVNRTDLDNCLTDNRTISVLCCRFNEAPDKTMSGLLKLAKDAGLDQRIAKETVLLILDREGEAENVIDIDEPVGDREEGREIRNEQVINDIQNALQLSDLEVHYFDIKSDNPKNLRKSLSQKATMLRDQYVQNASDIDIAIRNIEAELASRSANEAKAQVRNTLVPWIKKSQSCSPALKEYFLPLVSGIKNKGTYAASVRASVNRKGEWHNLDFYQFLAASSREQVVEQIGKLKDELIVLIDNMLSQNELQPAYALLKQLKQITEKRLGDIYQKTFSKGRAVYEEKLSSDNQFWKSLFNEWGLGPGYKDRISDSSSSWFYTQRYPDIEQMVTKQVAEEWQMYVNEIRVMLGAE